ncbi:unnamed protein product [Cyclocybe aegerita]|uniref:Uncharacterized protein n=1 Tax=Cyclocybe aegerita TaxID=1973307 RepID=A0A8S0WMB9_CYCAE|nr:unnamed protein product [Cyclocybe aegerita]
MSCPTFAPEVCDLFIDSLAQYPVDKSQREALRTCSLVSRDFAHPARQHIFRYVYAGREGRSGKSGVKMLRTLHKLVTWMPEGKGGISNIARYVKKVDCGYDQRPRDREGIERWEEQVSLILQALQGTDHVISTLDVLFHESWTNVGPIFKRALRDLLISPYLENLILRLLWDIPRSLFLGSHLRHISLDFCSVDPRICGPSLDAFYPQLESLEVDGSYELLLEGKIVENRRLMSQSALSSLRKLRYNIGDEGEAFTVLSRVQSTLEFLEIRFEDGVGFLEPSFLNLAHMEKLTRLRICDESPRKFPSFSSIQNTGLLEGNLLDCIQVPNTLRTFELDFEMHAETPTTDALVDDIQAPPSETNQWSRLNQFFSSPKFAKVEKVGIAIRLTVNMDPQDRAKVFVEVESLIKTALPYFSTPNVACALSVVVGSWYD